MENKGFTSTLTLFVITVVVLMVGVGGFLLKNWNIGTNSQKSIAVLSKDVDISKLVGDYSVLNQLYFNFDGTKVIRIMPEKDGKSHIYINEEEKFVFDEVGIEPPAYRLKAFKDLYSGPNGSDFVFWGKRDGKYYIVLDGKETESKYKRITTGPVFSPDGRMAYTAVDGATQEFVLIWGDEEKYRSKTFLNSPSFSLDSKQYAISGGNNIILNGAKIPVVAYETMFNSKGDLIYQTKTNFIYKTQSDLEEPRSFVVVAGKEDRKYQIIYGPVLSPNKTNMAYVGLTDQKSRVVLNGVDGRVYDWIVQLTFSPDDRVAYIAGTRPQPGVPVDEKFLVIDNKEIKINGDIDNGLTIGLKDRYAYSTGEHIVIDGVLQNSRGLVYYGPIFSPDANHVAWLMHYGGEKYSIFLDDQLMGEVDVPIARINHDRLEYLSFTPDSKSLAFGAINGREIQWIIKDIR